MYEKQVKGIKEEVLRMCWLMRGGVTYAEIMEMSSQERELITKIAKENVETTKKSGLPYF